MKKIILPVQLLSFLLAFGLSVIGQNYQTIAPKDTLFFSQTHNRTIGFKVDSTSFNGVSYFAPVIVDRRLGGCATANSSVLGQKGIQQPNGHTVFFNRHGDSIIIRTLAGLKESWMLMNSGDSLFVEGTLVSIDQEMILGELDSIKTIELKVLDTNHNEVSHPIGTQSFRIGKKFGFVEVPMLYNFSLTDPCFITDCELFKLVGHSKVEKGIKNLTWFEVNDFHVSDELHLRESTEIIDSYGITESSDKRTRIYFLERTDYFDSIVYVHKIEQSLESVRGDSSELKLFLDTTKMVILRNSDFDKLAGEPIFIEQEVLYRTETWRDENFFIKSIPGASRYYYGDVECLGQIVSGGGDECEKSYYKGLGGPYYSCTNSVYNEGSHQATETIRRELVYYSKADSTWGTPLILTNLRHLNDVFEIGVYPNPASEYVTFHLKNNDNLDLVSLFDQNGRMVHSIRCSNKECRINLSEIPSGVYLYRIQSALKEAFSGKLVVKR